MTAKEYDVLLREIMKLQERIVNLDANVKKMNVTIEELNKKTLVITDVNEELNKLKTDIQSLRDEGEM